MVTAFHEQGLVNRYVFHIAPTVSGALDAPGIFAGEDIRSLTAYTLTSASALGADLEIILDPLREKVVTP